MKKTGIALACALTLSGSGSLARAEESTPAQTAQAQEHSAAANLLTIVNIPARAILCGTSSLLASIFMAASAGRRYADAATMIEESCTGPWVITPEMISEGQGKDQVSASSLGYRQP